MLKLSLNTLTQRVVFLAIGGILGIAIAIGIGIFLPVRWRATSQLLVVQRPSQGIVDAYTAYRGALQAARTLEQLSVTSAFRQKALSRVPRSDLQMFMTLTEQERTRLWRERVNVSVLPEGGILRVVVLSEDPEAALRLSNGVNQALALGANEWLGTESVTVSVIDAPVVGDRPGQPDYIVLSFVGALVGLMGSACLLVYLSYRTPHHA